jgi:hypothetical protein
MPLGVLSRGGDRTIRLPQAVRRTPARHVPDAHVRNGALRLLARNASVRHGRVDLHRRLPRSHRIAGQCGVRTAPGGMPCVVRALHRADAVVWSRRVRRYAEIPQILDLRDIRRRPLREADRNEYRDALALWIMRVDRLWLLRPLHQLRSSRLTAARHFPDSPGGNLANQKNKGLLDQRVTQEFESNPGSQFSYYSRCCN